MSASNVYINWEGASFTPSGSGAVSINKVTSCKPSRGGSMEGFKGDLNLFWLVCAVPTQTRTFEVTTGDVGALLGIAIGSRGSFSIVLADAVNGITASGGGFTLAMTNCIVTGNTYQGEHAKFAEGTITFEGFDPSGSATEIVTKTAL